MANNYDEKITIGAEVVADEKSSEIAMDKLTKKLLKNLKDGYIEVPATIDFGKTSKEFKKAQTDLAREWKSMAKKGFFADKKTLTEKEKKDLTNFLSSVRAVGSYAKTEDKRSTNQWNRNSKGEEKGIGSIATLSELVRTYDKDVKKRKAQLAKLTKDYENRLKEKADNTSDDDAKALKTKPTRSKPPKKKGSLVTPELKMLRDKKRRQEKGFTDIDFKKENYESLAKLSIEQQNRLQNVLFKKSMQKTMSKKSMQKYTENILDGMEAFLSWGDILAPLRDKFNVDDILGLLEKNKIFGQGSKSGLSFLEKLGEIGNIGADLGKSTYNAPTLSARRRST